MTPPSEQDRLSNNSPGYLHDLDDDWDTYGGVKPSPAAIETAENIERYLAYVPISDGRVQFEFHCGDADLELVIDSDGKIREICFTAHA